MPFVLKTINNDGEEMFIHTAGYAVYCPELAAKYNDRKTALTMRLKLLKNKHYTNIEVENYTYDLIVKAHLKYHEKGEKVVNKTLQDLYNKS